MSLGRTHSATAALEKFCAQTKCHFSLVFNVGDSIRPRPFPKLRTIDRRNVDQLQKIDLVVDEHVDGLALSREVGDAPERLEPLPRSYRLIFIKSPRIRNQIVISIR